MSEPMDSVEQAQARERAQNTLTPEQVLETMRDNDLLDPKVYAKLRQMRSQLIPSLKQAMQERKGYTRLNAGSLLLHLGEAEGTEAFITALRQPDEPYLPRTVLIDLAGMKLRVPAKAPDIFSHLQPLPLQRQPVFEAVVPYLRNPDKDLRKFAVEVLVNLDLPQTEETILPLLKDQSQEVRLAVVRWFALSNKDRGALDVLEELLFAQKRDLGEQSVIRNLEDYIESNNPVLVQRAIDLLTRYVLNTIQQPRQPANDAISRMNQSAVANSLHWALKAIAKANTPQEKSLLMAVIESAAEDWVRGHALERLGQLDSKTFCAKVQTLLGDRELGEYAAAALADLIRKQPDTLALVNRPVVLTMVLEQIHQAKRPDTISKFLEALMALGGDVGGVAPAVVEQLDPFQKIQVVWKMKQLTPRKLGDRLIDAGIIQPLNDQQWRKIEQLWQRHGDAFGVVTELLANQNRIISFDAETSIPVDYRKLIEDLIQISQDHFQVSAVSQFRQADRVSLGEQVQFVHNNRVYRFQPEDMGDWYDVDATLAALNRALQESGRSERFIALLPDGQFPIIVFATDPTFRAIAQEFAVPLAQPAQGQP